MGLDGTGGGDPERERNRRMVADGGLEGGDAAEERGDHGDCFFFFLVAVSLEILFMVGGLSRIVIWGLLVAVVGLKVEGRIRGEVGLRRTWVDGLALDDEWLW